MQFTPEHEELRRSLQRFIAAEINPHVDAVGGGRHLSGPRACSRRWATLGLLGINKPVEYGGRGSTIPTPW